MSSHASPNTLPLRGADDRTHAVSMGLKRGVIELQSLERVNLHPVSGVQFRNRT